MTQALLDLVALQDLELPPGIEPLALWAPSPGQEGTPILVDNMLTRWLRPHQREGVQFMFECVNGLRSYEGKGEAARFMYTIQS